MKSLKTAPDDGILVVIPSGGAVFDSGRVLLDIKASEGLVRYAQLWPGRVRCLYRATEAAQMSYARWYDPGELPFEVLPLSPDAMAPEVAQQARGATLVLASGDNHRDLGLVDMLAGTSVVLIIEYSLRTRLDILKLGDGTLFQRLKTGIWLLKTERLRRRDLARAAGLQANGTPAFDRYGPANTHPFLYFDTRLREVDFIGLSGAEEKARGLVGRETLNLVYSGRLEMMKGAEHLIPIAARLKQRGNTQFMLHIFGDGSLAPAMTAGIAEHGLEKQVVMHGPVDFDESLVPFLKSSADLFLCCHPQGDPACTYLETLGCGVPVVGFRNEAFAGVVKLGQCGDAVPIGDRHAMVAAIERLDADRSRLGELMRGAAAVARPRLFENTFANRVGHLMAVAGLTEH